MSRRRISAITLAAACCLVRRSQADEIGWRGVAGDWFDPNNWTDYNLGSFQVPSSSDDAIVYGGQPQISTSDAAANNLQLDFGGICTLNDGASLTVGANGGSEQVGISDAGTFNQTGGSANANSLQIGLYGGSNGVYTLGGDGSLTVTGNEVVGQYGTGTFTQTGGTNSVQGEFDLAAGSISTSTYSLSAGSFSAMGGAYLGGASTGSGGQAVFTLSDPGQFSAAGLTVYGNAQWNVNGGTATASALNLTGSYTQTAGTASLGQITGSGQVSITGGKTTLTPGGGASTVASLAINSGGMLDITNNRLVINYGSPAADPIAAIQAAIASGAAFSGGQDSWDGSGITSSMAGDVGGKTYGIAYLDGNNPADALYGTVGPNQIVVKYTIAGDAFLQNSIGFRDLLTVAQDYGFTGMDYAQGCFDYDASGSVGFYDLLLVAQSYGQSFNLSGSSPADVTALDLQSIPASAIPEPGTALLALTLVGGLLSRRRTHRDC